MANYNLTSQQIKDTYQQLVQVSGSALVDGTGSLISGLDYVPTSTYNAFTSSYKIDSASFDSRIDSKLETSTFLAYTSSNSSSIANLQTQIDALEAGSGSADWDLISGKPAGLVSSSAQLADDISGSFTSTSASLAAGIATNKSDIGTKLATSTFTSYSSSVSTRLTTDEANISTNASNISTNATDIASLTAETSSYAVKTSNNVFSGTQTFESIAVNGTASIAYLQAITGSAKIVGDAFIILNADTPSQRYAGLKVYDSGSSPISTGSFIWDSVNNDWFYEYQKDATDYAVALFGPEFATKGTPSYPGTHKVQKGTGGHHLGDSNITDDGTTVSISTPLTATEITASTGFKGNLSGNADTATSASYALTASFALNTGASAGLIASGLDSVQSSDITSTPATASGTSSVAIGQGANATNYAVAIGALSTAGDEQVSIGYNNTNPTGYGIAIGYEVTNQGGGNVGVGRRIDFNGGAYSIGIGENVSISNSNGVAIGYAASNNNNGVAIGANAIASNGYNVAIGEGVAANNDAGVAIGAQTALSSNQSIIIGVEGNIDGSSVGAIGIGQGVDIDTSAQGISIGQKSSVTADKAITIGSGSSNSGNSGIVLGAGSTNNSANGIVVGQGSSVTSANGIAIGNNTTAGNNGLAMLANASAASLSVSIGYNSGVSVDRAVAIGTGTGVSAARGVAIGFGSSANGGSSIAIGDGASTSNTDEINIGDIFKYDGSSDVTFGSTSVNFGTNITEVVSGSSTGSLVDNLHPTIASSSAQIKHIVTLDQNQYSALSGSGNVYDDTFYIIKDGGTNVWYDNLEVQGQIYSPTFAGGIASSTSSIDFDNGNFATLNCATSTFLANPSNIKSGTTYTIIITNGANISGYGSNYKFAAGTAPTFSTGTDVLTMVSDGTNLYGTGLANFS